ncbi:hypothetical protein QJS04_geneDACA003504 [Acorus gramineus]|uniref:Uncharacterized protein n=1 Tax=Acorus gramineus TaxID=55184 RepID=A0AAV9BPQ1_ACOGR|nr:hypothetical protein QJS04_geneDACA003504 [Acorus gramineus]
MGRSLCALFLCFLLFSALFVASAEDLSERESLVSGGKNVLGHARSGAQRHSTTSHACSSARNAASSAGVCRLGPTRTRKPVRATTTGRPKRAAPDVLNPPPLLHQLYICSATASSVIWEDE